MKIDLLNGAYLQIGGELGKYNSLPIDVLVKVAQHLQELISSIAQFDLPDSEFLNPDNFRIEIVDFKKGSAVPAFAFSQRSEYRVGTDCEHQRTFVNEKFEQIIELADTGHYMKLVEMYPDVQSRNPIVEKVYAFVNDFGNSPVSFVDYNKLNDTVTPIYKLNKFKSATKKDLIAISCDVLSEKPETELAIGKIKLYKKKSGKTKMRIVSVFPKKYNAEYAPSVIVGESSKYILKYPLRCKFEKVDDFFVIESEMLGLIGTGYSEDEAELAFSEEFDYLFMKLSSLGESEFTKHNRFIKNVLEYYIEKVES